ncbi:hypothetical protein D0A38_07555 [Xanthomonas campestris pv. incanae]|nr:hypothetical protein D0A38_07555 [Xanthomonas campestris pv. incanae]
MEEFERDSEEVGWSPSPVGASRHSLRAMGARALERPRRKRGPGRGAGVGGEGTAEDSHLF